MVAESGLFDSLSLAAPFLIALLQRVTWARVAVAGEAVAKIDAGLLVLAAVRAGDDEGNAERLARRILGYRVFADAQGRMNLSLTETGGELLLVPQFTLAADTRKGRRASFAGAADPAVAKALFERLAHELRASHQPRVVCGRFGADMQVSLTNDGPVTFWLKG